MSQQEFFPQSESERDQANKETPQSPYYWSTQPRKEGEPRDEPPGSIDEPIMPGDMYQTGYNGSSSYPSEGYAGTEAQPRIVDANPVYSQQQQQRSAGNGPYQNQPNQQWGQWGQGRQAQWGTPGWARPQNQFRGNRWHPGRIFWLIIMVLFFARPLWYVLGFALKAAGILVGLAFGGIIALVIFLLLATIFTRILFRAVGGPSYGRRRFYRNYRRRGPWWW